MFKIDSNVLNSERAVVRLQAGNQGGDVDPVMVGQKRQTLLGAGCDLAEEELRLIGRRIAFHSLFAERPFLDPPGPGNALAGMFDVKVVHRFDGPVDVDEPVEIGGPDGSDFHARMIANRRRIGIVIRPLYYIGDGKDPGRTDDRQFF